MKSRLTDEKKNTHNQCHIRAIHDVKTPIKVEEKKKIN